MIYVDACSSTALTTLRLDIGSRVEIARSSIGRAFLSAINPAERDYLFSKFAARYGADWPDLKARVEDGIAQVRERGFCLVDGEWQTDVRAVGAPLVSPDGASVMAMNCGGPAFALDRARLEGDLGPRLVHLCRSIAPMLGR